MLNSDICKERILSEDYRDFILDDIRTVPTSGAESDYLCEQDAGHGYRCLYLSALQAEPLTLARFPYTSIPKCYTPLSLETLNQAGILPIQNYPTLQLKGRGVLIGFLDSGIDYTSSVFRNLDGSSRILGIWDQTIPAGPPPDPFLYGTEYTQEQLNEALQSDDPLSVVPSKDTDGHGTFVAGLAAGSGVPKEGVLGAAPEASLAVVKLKQAKQYLRDYYFIPDNAVCYQETDIILGLRYLELLADRLSLPLVVCVALGTNSGGHVGALPFSGLLETLGGRANRVPVVGVGNEADKRHHFHGQMTSGTESQTVEIRVGESMPGFTLELWTSIPNVLSVSITSPSGETSSALPVRTSGHTDFLFLLENTRVSVDTSLLVERTTYELLFFRFNTPTAGIWKINILPVRVIDGSYHLWLPVTEFLESDTFFLESDPYYTITNPGNTFRPVIVSYYNGNNNAVALSSGRGYERLDQTFPDLTAPGIDVKGILPDGRFAVRSGSSVSTAITAGACALLMEWILFHLGADSVDSYQIRGLLVLGAVRPPSMTFPNPEWGYGQLNLFHTFDELRQY